MAGQCHGGKAMKVLTIAGNSVRLLFRDRSNIFFVLILPIVLILVIGLMFGGAFTPRVGVVLVDDGPSAADLAGRLDSTEGIDVVRVGSEEDARLQVRRNQVDAALIVPDGYDATLAAGDVVTLAFITTPDANAFEVQTLLDTSVAEHAAAIRAGRFAADVTGVGVSAATEQAVAIRADLPVVTIAAEGGAGGEAVGQFGFGAVNNLVLFVFITALTSSTALIQARQLGVSRRMFSTPTSAGTIIAGETLGRFLVTLLQALFIVIASALLFGVKWGDPLGAAMIVTGFSLVGTGAGMLIGSTFSNAEQAGGLSVFFSLVLAALGGAMVPLELFGDTMRQIAHVTPHAWAIDGFTELIRFNGVAADIGREIAVLFGMGIVLIVLASWQFRRVLTR